ncbi:MAG: efflux RND transporter periplasmic adaptor subunit [Vulcanimicrobiota bacterium]
MRVIVLIVLIFLSVGCQTTPESGSIATPSETTAHDHEDHEEHGEEEHSEEEGFITLTPAQKKELNITTRPVILALAQTTGLRPGRIEADPDQQVVISSQVSGILQKLFVQVGSRIKAGTTIAVIASPEVTSLQADYHEAEVEAELARKELANKMELFRVGDEFQQPLETTALEVAEAKAERDGAAARLKSAVLKNERLETLLSEGIASKQQVEESRALRETLEAELERAEAALEIAKRHQQREKRLYDSRLSIKAEALPAEARLARASEQMKHARERLEQLGANAQEHNGLVVLSSPIDGTVVERGASRGEAISPGEAVAKVVDSSKVWVWVDLQRSDLDFIDQGDPMELSLVKQPGQTARGYIDYISPQINQETQTLRARVVLTDPPQGFQLGSFVNARVSNGTGNSLPAVPQEAVQFVEGVTVVYIREQEGYKRTPVDLGASVGENLVVAHGVEVGDQVVVNSVEQLKALDLSDTIGGHSH